MTPGPDMDRSYKCYYCSEINFKKPELYNHIIIIISTRKKGTVCAKVCVTQSVANNFSDE